MFLPTDVALFHRGRKIVNRRNFEAEFLRNKLLMDNLH